MFPGLPGHGHRCGSDVRGELAAYFAGVREYEAEQESCRHTEITVKSALCGNVLEWRHPEA